MLNQQRFYRVQLGPLASVEEADQVLQKLIDSGHPDARIAVN
jgi:rare lipoprotein A